MLSHATTIIGALGVAVAIWGCRNGDTIPRGSALTAATRMQELTACAPDSLRPSTAAPAEGLWLDDAPQPGGRIAVMIGPAQTIVEDVRVVRRLEAIEVAPDGDTLRHEADAVAVRLELLPLRALDALGSTAADTTRPAQPVATYAVGPNVTVAAYEPCAAGTTPPRLRYLRRGAHGRVVTDVMLHRVSGG